RQSSSLLDVAVNEPATVMPVLATILMSPDPAPPSPVDTSCAVGVIDTWQPCTKIVPPNAAGWFTASVGATDLSSVFTVATASAVTVMSALNSSADTSIAPFMVTLPRASNENSSPEPKPLAMPNIGPVIWTNEPGMPTTPAEMSTVP